MNRASLGILLLSLVCCGGSGEPATDSVTLYSGRNESLIGPLLERFTAATGVPVRVRYGDTAELAATLLEEGPATPADVFLSQDAAALGALASAGMLRALPRETLQRIPARWRSSAGDWVGLSGRARVVVYNTERVRPDELPRRLQQVTDPRYRGRFGIAPTNASFQAHMAAVLTVRGEAELRELLAAIAANRPVRYPKNGPIVDAVIAGEIDWGLVNHYYLWRALQENPDAPARNFFMPDNGASGFLNLSGVGVLRDGAAAIRLVDFLVGDEAQRYFAEQTFEYPLAPGVPAAGDLPPLESLHSADVDFAALAPALERTLALIEESGLTRF